jgi:hypothetical protein
MNNWEEKNCKLDKKKKKKKKKIRITVKIKQKSLLQLPAFLIYLPVIIFNCYIYTCSNMFVGVPWIWYFKMLA